VTLRLRQTGDSLKLPGRHKKTIKKWLIDEKIPRWDRDALPVLDHGGTPAALVGLGPDAHFLPQPGQEAWHFTASR
jgi:tRNA(Ile)-lysidine synthase